MDPQPNGIMARLDAMHQDIRDLKAWAARHDATHQALADASRARAVELERRVTTVEERLRTRSGLGAVGIIVGWALSIFGVNVRNL